ncbi:MAG: hydroxymethylbilane synthase [Deltaproteobacteria bacterium]|nr:hydroxymethylbilane synthase [Deltaproteobacteria bacterium]
MSKLVKIGTRGSALAIWQAEWVRDCLLAAHADLSIELVRIKTQGDKILDVPLAMVGGKGLFVKEIEEALLDKRVDLAVHSMKDMPAEIPDGLCIGAVPERETPWDVLISKDSRPFEKLPEGAVIGTSSLRRGSQLKHIRPDIRLESLRGNLDTRIRKLETENLDAIILAAAGVKRLGMEDRITEYLTEDIMLPAIGQGALGIEIREDDDFIREIVGGLNHPESKTVVFGERAFLNRLEGGCQVPIAAFGKINGSMFELTGLVAEVDGSKVIRQSITGPPEESEALGVTLAERLLDAGAGEILAKIYHF